MNSSPTGINLSRILELTIPGLIVFAVSWGVFTVKVNIVEAETRELKSKYESVLEMKSDIAVIKNDIGYIKDSINDKKQ